jgi:hypothetical protein
MPDLAEMQSGILRFLTGRGDPPASLLAQPGGASVHTRLDIYRNAYRLRLREAIETDHQVLGRYLGDELFERMVDGYIQDCPSACTSLRDFTADLPRFLSETPPFSEHPLLAELSGFERLLLDVFDARDAPRVLPQALRDLATERWPGLRLRFHPSVQLFAAQWNSVESWRAIQGGAAPPAASRKTGDGHWLLWRGADRLSQFHPITPDEHAMLVGALHGESFAALCERMTLRVPEGQVSGYALGLLQKWLAQGLIAALDSSRA